MGTKSDLHTLPGDGAECDPALRAAGSQLVAQLCLPTRTVVQLASVGAVALRAGLVARSACAGWWAGDKSAGEAVVLDCAGHAAVLFLERRLAVGLVNAVLGLGVPPFGGPLSRIERGILEGTIATLLAKLAPLVTIRAEPAGWTATSAAPPAGAYGVELLVEVRGECGRACLMASDEFLGRVWPTREANAREVSPWLQVAVTRVRGAELAGVEPGDVVVFDETAALEPSGTWPVCVRRRETTIAARWLVDGLVVADQCGRDAQLAEAVTHPDRRASIAASPAAGAGQEAFVELCAGALCPAVDFTGRTLLVVRREAPLLLKRADLPWAYGTVGEFAGAFAVTVTQKLQG
jgi:hypothetical protein